MMSKNNMLKECIILEKEEEETIWAKLQSVRAY